MTAVTPNPGTNDRAVDRPQTAGNGTRGGVAARQEASLLPPVDVIEDSTGITLYADMPGVPKERLNLRVEGDQLSIEGEMALAVPQGMEATYAEVQRSRFYRAFTLSKELDADKVSAELAQGVLRVRIPKAEHAQPRKIAVSVG